MTDNFYRKYLDSFVHMLIDNFVHMLIDNHIDMRLDKQKDKHFLDSSGNFLHIHHNLGFHHIQLLHQIQEDKHQSYYKLQSQGHKLHRQVDNFPNIHLRHRLCYFQMLLYNYYLLLEIYNQLLLEMYNQLHQQQNSRLRQYLYS